MKKILRNLVFGSALVGALAGCGERIPPTLGQMGCEGLTVSRESVNGADMFDHDCNGTIDFIRSRGNAGGRSNVLMKSPTFEDFYPGHPHLGGTVLMNPRMQALADSIYSLQNQLYFLEDSTRYWANRTGDTTNLRGSTNLSRVKNREQ